MNEIKLKDKHKNKRKIYTYLLIFNFKTIKINERKKNTNIKREGFKCNISKRQKLIKNRSACYTKNEHNLDVQEEGYWLPPLG